MFGFPVGFSLRGGANDLFIQPMKVNINKFWLKIDKINLKFNFTIDWFKWTLMQKAQKTDEKIFISQNVSLFHIFIEKKNNHVLTISKFLWTLKKSLICFL